MWIVELALRRPYTFVVMALAIIVFGVVAIVRMPADIFPNIDIPVVAMIWSYGGISPEEMADGITTRVERNATTTINDIEHMESASLTGYSIIKIFLHPSGSADAAVAEANASASAVIRVLPPGTQPPSVTQYNAASVPIAAGVLYPFLGILISPIWASAAMSLSSLSVVGNALRLRHVQL